MKTPDQVADEIGKLREAAMRIGSGVEIDHADIVQAHRIEKQAEELVELAAVIVARARYRKSHHGSNAEKLRRGLVKKVRRALGFTVP